MAVPKNNVVVNLYLEGSETIVATATTNAQGVAAFPNLAVGVYTAKVVLPAGYSHNVEDIENIYSDTNQANDDISVVAGNVVLAGIDVVQGMPSYATVVIDLFHEVGFAIAYTPGTSMAIRMVNLLPVDVEEVFNVTWSLMANNIGDEWIVRNAGLTSVFTIAANATYSNTVTVIDGFDDGYANGLDAAPVDDDVFVIDNMTGPSLAIITVTGIKLNSINNLEP